MKNKEDDTIFEYNIHIKKVLYKNSIAHIEGYMGNKVLLTVEGKKICTDYKNIKLID